MVVTFVNTMKNAQITVKYKSRNVCNKMQYSFVLLTGTDDTHEDIK
jgi:hypothetical protein